jgi:hypothetical protein
VDGVVVILAGLLVAGLGAVLGANVRGVGERVATFAGMLTFWFGGGDALPQRSRAYRAWGVVLFVLGAITIAVGVAALT